eukprot:GDKJ01006650.1.p1 GENE.GDKJ01006650.1~~GDKJ01006650.1.p1  ORF type:complete len:587 (-),score=8.83 GDKJ01006650.1:42-1802(-)
MQFKKLKYLDELTKEEDVNTSTRVEYFINYWQLVFYAQDVIFDKYYLKSHRTIIEKVKLQIEGNFFYAHKYITQFYDDEHYGNDNILIKRIVKKKVKRAIDYIIQVKSTSKTAWENEAKANIQPRKHLLRKHILTIKNWIDSSYSFEISKCLIELLEKNTPIDNNDKEDIKKLTNYFIIELFNKGFNAKLIKELPEILFDIDRFPFEKSDADFTSNHEYNEYKKNEWETLTLKKQIESIVNLLNRPLKTRYLIFRVFDVNWRCEPLHFLDVEFYNPNIGFNPKITLKEKLPSIIFNETFSLNYNEDENKSQCNAFVKVEGLQEEQIYLKGYKKVKLALSVLNRELELNGKVFVNNVFVTNSSFNRIWGTTNALPQIGAIDEILEYQKSRLHYIDKLKQENEEDKRVLNFISVVSDILTDKMYYPGKLWVCLEALFESESNIKELIKAILKLYLNNYYLIEWKNILSNSLTQKHSLLNPEDYILSKEVAEKLSINTKTAKSELRRFQKNIHVLKSEIDSLIIEDIVDNIQLFSSNKSTFNSNIDTYVEYVITELYIERNLTLHRNMSDELFLLKRKEIKNIMKIFIE